MQFLSSNSTIKASSLSYDQRDGTPVRDFRGTAKAILVEAFQKVAFTMFVLLCTTAPGFSESGQNIVFDAPSAGTVAGYGTFPFYIDDLGRAVGNFVVDNLALAGWQLSSRARHCA